MAGRSRSPAARGDKPLDSIPGPYGAHNWHPMSFNPQTGLVYLPAQNVPLNLTPEKTWSTMRNDARQIHCGLRLEPRLHAECNAAKEHSRSDG